MNVEKNRKYFESQQPDEEVIFVVRRHIIALMPIFAISFFLYFLGFLAIFILPSQIPMLVNGFAYNIYVLIVSLLFLFNTVFLFSNWVLHYLHIALLTTEHFVEIDQYGLFGRKVSSLTLDRIQDVSNDQRGLIHTIFNLGSVQVQTAGELPNFTLRFVPDPYKICQTIMETEEDYSTRHGLRPSNVAETQTNEEMQPETVTSPNIEYPGGEWKQEQK